MCPQGMCDDIICKNKYWEIPIPTHWKLGTNTAVGITQLGLMQSLNIWKDPLDLTWTDFQDVLLSKKKIESKRNLRFISMFWFSETFSVSLNKFLCVCVSSSVVSKSLQLHGL